MNSVNKSIPEDIAPEVLQLASCYYAEHSDSYSMTELIEAGAEVNIPPIFIEQAIKDIEKKHEQRRHKQQQRKQQRQLFARIGAGILVINTLWGILTYNLLSSSRSDVQAAWAQVENQLERRADLIPKLMSVAQSSTHHEKVLVTELRESRQAYLEAETPSEKAGAVKKIDQAIANFYSYIAAHPSLQSTQLYSNLQYEIAGTENRIAVERRRYNQAVQAYNSQREQFPNSVVAKVFGFQRQAFFEATQ